MRYRPEIDGLRAFAVVPVILFHMGFDWMAGGFIGVDVFFVISGFLITSIVMRQLEDQTFSFRDFWARRIRRILPALIVVIAVTLIAAFLLVFKGDHPLIGRQATAALMSVANIYFWYNIGDYWGMDAEESPFLHTWSLSVEEQFYLFLPIAVWLVVRFDSRLLRNFFLAVIVASLSLFLYGALFYPSATFYLLPSRAWELATGGYLATFYFHGDKDDRPESDTFTSLAFAGLCMILVSYLFVPSLNGGLTVAVLGTSLVIAFAQSGICYSILAQRHIVYIGKMSYSLYLWHWPVIVFAKYLGFDSKWLLIAVIYMLSMASYNLVEKPARRPRPGTIPIIGACYVVTIGICCLLLLPFGQYDTSEFAQSTSYFRYYDLMPRTEYSETFERTLAGMPTSIREAPPDTYLTGGIIVGCGDSDPKIVVLGDSHGVMWSPAIRFVAEKLGVKTSFYSMNAVSPFIRLPLCKQNCGVLSPAEKLRYDEARLHFLSEWKPRVVIVCARWSKVEHESARDLLTFLEASNTNVLLVEQPPELAIGNRNAAQYFCYKKVKPEDDVRKYFPLGNVEAYQDGRQLVRTLADRYRNCEFIPMFDLYSRDSRVLGLDGRDVVYLDNDHLTTYGAHLAIDRIEQSISAAMNTFEGTPEIETSVSPAEIPSDAGAT